MILKELALLHRLNGKINFTNKFSRYLKVFDNHLSLSIPKCLHETDFFLLHGKLLKSFDETVNAEEIMLK